MIQQYLLIAETIICHPTTQMLASFALGCAFCYWYNMEKIERKYY